ncbi:putative cytochrome b561 YceJ [uncultured Thiomicrorhabdus sp.]
MQWRNHSNSYGIISIGLHWLLAIALLAMFIVGTWMVDLSYYSEWYHRAPELHKAAGVVILLLMVVRLIWRWSNPRPAPLGKVKWQNRSAELLHQLFYLLVILIAVSGYLISTAEGKGIDVFGLFTLPALNWQFELQADRAGIIHKYLAWAFMLLVGLHLGAALKHHFINRDNTLKRMLNPLKGDIHADS